MNRLLSPSPPYAQLIFFRGSRFAGPIRRSCSLLFAPYSLLLMLALRWISSPSPWPDNRLQPDPDGRQRTKLREQGVRSNEQGARITTILGKAKHVQRDASP